MTQVNRNGIFITFPVISVTQQENGERLIDRFDINAVAENIVGVNGLDGASKHAINGGKAVVHFRTDSGMRAIISDADIEDIIDALTETDFVSFDVVSVSDDEKSGARRVERYTGYADPYLIVGVNALDGQYKQVTDDVRSIIYFKPASGLRPTLSSETAEDIMDRLNEWYYD